MKKIYLLIFFIFLASCNSSNYQQNLEKLDKIHGKCDNPYRTYGPIEYKICKDKERAAGPDGIVDEPTDVAELFSKIGGGGTTVMKSDTNNYLWDSSIQLVSPYSLKISDFDGGFIETNWIMNQSSPDSRCLIKIHITSVELVSDGVDVRILCEDKINEIWYQSENSYLKEEKELTLKILTEAARLSSNSRQKTNV